MTYEDFLKQHKDITDSGIRLALLALRDKRMDVAERLLDELLANLSALHDHRRESEDIELKRLAEWNKHKSFRKHSKSRK